MKTKIILLLLIPTLFLTAFAPEKLVTKNGHVWFYSRAPLEDIEAHSRQAAAVINTQKGTIAVAIPIMSFEFKKTLMQEHFNENYMESAKYPTAKFTGAVNNLSEIDLKKNGIYKTTVEGDLTIRNVTRQIKADGTVEVKDGKFNVKSKFNIDLKDYNITVEKRLANNIAPTIEINIDLNFQ